MNKYELIGEPNEYGLRRIRYLSDGSLGGWLESETNLSQSGNARVYDDAHVFGNARVFGIASVFGNARVFGNAHVFGDARVYGDASVFDNASVFGDVYDDASVFGNAHVYDDAHVFGDARVYDDAHVFGNARVFGNASVFGNARVSKTPICLSGLYWLITITETHMFIGCQGHTHAEWASFDDDTIKRMDVRHALKFWEDNAIILLTLCERQANAAL